MHAQRAWKNRSFIAQEWFTNISNIGYLGHTRPSSICVHLRNSRELSKVLLESFTWINLKYLRVVTFVRRWASMYCSSSWKCVSLTVHSVRSLNKKPTSSRWCSPEIQAMRMTAMDHMLVWKGGWGSYRHKWKWRCSV